MPQILNPAVIEGAREARANKAAAERGPVGVEPMADPMQVAAEQANRPQARGAIGGGYNQFDYFQNEFQRQKTQQEEQALMEQKMQNTALAMMNPVEMLRQQSESTEEELSLQSLTKKQKEKILKSFVNCRTIAKDYYETIIEPAVENRREIYYASAEHYDKVFPQLSQYCRWTSRDVKTVCDWILPGLMEVFTGSEAPLSVKGVNIEDDERAEKIQQLITYQLERKNDYHSWVNAEMKTALKENWSIAKLWWKREEERTPMVLLLDSNDSDSIVALMSGSATGKLEITNIEPLEEATDFFKVEYDEIKLKSNYPVLEYLPSSEFRYTPDAPNLQNCKFVAHRKIVNGDYLKRKELDGIYTNISKALNEYDEGDLSPTRLDQENDFERTEKENRPYDDDEASKEVELYEAYLNVDYNDDGVMERIIVHAVGDNLIRVAKNDFDFIPFYICSAVYDKNAVFNKESFSEDFEQHQDLKTALVRQVIVNTAKNNMPRIFANEQKVDMDSLVAGDEIIPTQGNPTEAIMTPPSLPLSGITMDMIHYAQNEIEAQSGSTRYNQGLDSNSLNHTATGITAVLGASEKRNKLMARSIAENFIIPIFKDCILMNQKFMEDEQMVRLTNKNVSIRKEDLDIDYDLIVNVGQGAGSREAQIQYLMYTLQSLYPQLVQLGVVDAKGVYNLVCKLLEALGLRDTTQFLLDPESQKAQDNAKKKQEEALAARAQQLQDSIQLAIAKSSVPRVSIPIGDLPPDAQRAFLLQKLGIETTERAIAEHEEFQKND